MKKIFLIPMMAMMCTIAAWGDVFNVATESDLRYALSTAPTDGTERRINLTKSISGLRGSELSGRFVVPEYTNIVLNLGSYTLSAEGFDGEEFGDGIGCYATILNKGNLKMVAEGDGIVIGALCETEGGESFDWTTMTPIYTPAGQEGGIPIVTYGNLTIEGGVYTCQDLVESTGVPVGPCIIWGYGDSNITINGGLFTAGRPHIQPAFGVVHKDSGTGTLQINGGKFYKNIINGENLSTHVPTNVIEDFSTCDVKVISGVDWGSGSSAPYTGYWVAPAGTASPADGSSVSGEETAMFIASGAEVTIAEGNTLNITKDLAFQDATSKLTIAPGATLIVGDEIISSSTDNLELTMNEVSRKYSRLLIKAGQLQETHPKATVKLEAICTENADGTHKWQRFAVPTYLENVKKADFATETGYNTDLFGWDYENDRWSGVSDSENLKPFQCYNMTVDEQVAPVYTFKCELVGNGNPSIALHNEWNYLANSYTAPMNLTAMLQSLINEEQYRSLNAAVWVQKKPGSKDWQSSTFADILDGTLRVKEINPMQAFIYYKLDGTAATIDLDYEAFVYNPLFPKAGAPSRNKVVSEYDYTRASIVVEAENGDEDIVMLYLSDEFSASVMDNGFDIPKYKNTESFNFFAVTELGNLERVGSNSLDGIALVLETKNETSYTVKFENVNLDGYVLLDNETEVSTPIAEESEYTFTAEANSTIEGRFVIVKQQATGIENAAATAKKGIYSMTGVYMGENLENIPAGMYIINGKKVVK